MSEDVVMSLTPQLLVLQGAPAGGGALGGDSSCLGKLLASRKSWRLRSGKGELALQPWMGVHVEGE